MCNMANSFRRSDLGIRLSQAIEQNPESTWSYVRHYLGRLGSWFRATRNLTKASVEFPGIFGGYEIQTLKTPRTSVCSTSPAECTSFDELVTRALPHYNADYLRAAIDRALGTRKRELIKVRLEQHKQTNFRPQVHAECLLLDYFHTHGLDFVHEDPYIGCSKPSCYCCDLYIRHHPGNFVARPSHGNIWPKWSFPEVVKSDHDPASIHIAGVLSKMLEKMKYEVESALVCGKSVPRNVLDSTTGLSRSA